MIPITKLKKDLVFSKEVAELVEVLKGAASSEFRHLQSKMQIFERLDSTLKEFFSILKVDAKVHPFLRTREDLPKGVVMIASDEGFLGELNTLVINAALKRTQKGDELIVLGERGARFMEDAGHTFTYFPGVGEEIDYAQAERLRDYLVKIYLDGKVAELFISFARFISLTQHKIEVVSLLPCSFLFSEPQEEGGKEALNPASRIPEFEVLIEPSSSRVVDYLVSLWLGKKIYDIFWLSKLAEWAARIMHLESSSQEISRLNQRLTFQYFRHLHSISDKNIREIFASRLLWKE